MTSTNSSSSEVKVDPRRIHSEVSGRAAPVDIPIEPRETSVRDGAAPDRWQRISQRAYELAQHRSFAPGSELSDWLQAEREIDGETP